MAIKTVARAGMMVEAAGLYELSDQDFEHLQGIVAHFDDLLVGQNLNVKMAFFLVLFDENKQFLPKEEVGE